MTYCLTPAEGAGPSSGRVEPEREERERAPSTSVVAHCCNAVAVWCDAPTTAAYALIGLSRCWWQYTVTSSSAGDNMGDAMQEGVATEIKGGAKPGVTEVGWPLPCSLSSLLAMNCRARAEGLARRLQTSLRVGSGGSVALEQTSLVTPGPEDHYASMECRHASLDDPELDPVDDPNLRPIHVVTSEPSLRLCLPSPPALPNVAEQDSDVYYDFDLASPEDAPEDEEKECDNVIKRYERPESGCATSVTSPVMFDDECEDEGEEKRKDQEDHTRSPEANMCTSEAELRVMRQILTSASLTDVLSPTDRTAETDAKALCDDSSRYQSANGTGKCVCGACRFDDEGECGCSSGHLETHYIVTHTWGEPEESCADGIPEGAAMPGDSYVSLSMQETSPVANTDPRWCHPGSGTPPAVPHPPADQRAVDKTNIVSGDSDGAGWDRYDARSDMYKHSEAVIIKDKGWDKGKKDQSKDVLGDGEGDTVYFAEVTVTQFSGEGETVCSDGDVEHKADTDTEGKIILQTAPETASVPQAISGTTPPLADPHLYTPSEGQPAVMESRGEAEGRDELFCMDADAEEIETLGEDEESDDEENEEDIDEEVILTGKFRNIRGYTERVRRLSDDIEDRISPTSITYEDNCFCESPKSSKSSTASEVDDGGEELAAQLSQLEVEDVDDGVGDEEVDEEALAGERSSSEETDPARVEDFKLRIKRSSSLKCGKTPPGTPGRKKIVRFADMLGLDLAAVRTFLAGVPHVPRSAFWDLELEREAAEAAKSSFAQNIVPTRVLTPLFQQPGSQVDFLERVRQQRVVVENIEVGDDLSVRGVVRVLSLDFHKSVFVRYTFDQWRNYHEATAAYVPGSYDGLTDRFSFLLWGNFLQDDGALIFCVRYHTLGQEFWDNNRGRDYVLQCYKTSGTAGVPGMIGSSVPQNVSSVEAHYSGGRNFSSRPTNFSDVYGTSPTTPSDPWASRFF